MLLVTFNLEYQHVRLSFWTFLDFLDFFLYIISKIILDKVTMLGNFRFRISVFWHFLNIFGEKTYSKNFFRIALDEVWMLYFWQGQSKIFELTHPKVMGQALKVWARAVLRLWKSGSGWARAWALPQKSGLWRIVKFTK